MLVSTFTVEESNWWIILIQKVQSDINGYDRKVWMFLIRSVLDNDVKKPQMFVFSDIDDYNTRGKNVDTEYTKLITSNKNNVRKSTPAIQIIPKLESKPHIVLQKDLIGKKIKHKVFDIGTIIDIDGQSIVVMFDKVGEKKIGYEFCIQKQMIEFV